MEIVNKPSFHVVGWKFTCSWSELGREMPRGWKVFLARLDEIRRVDDHFMDICLQRVGDVFTQLICAQVRDLSHIPQGMVGVEIPAQKYVFTRHSGPVTEIALVFAEMQRWAHENGCHVDPKDFKIDSHAPAPESPHELYIKLVHDQ